MTEKVSMDREKIKLLLQLAPLAAKDGRGDLQPINIDPRDNWAKKSLEKPEVFLQAHAIAQTCLLLEILEALSPTKNEEA